MPKPLNLIVACSENRIIGRNGQLPWRIAEDWKYFRRQTTGRTVILGRISFESWRSIFDDERDAIVLTRKRSLAGPRAQVADSLASALALAESSPREIYICGGQRIFEEAIALPQAARLYLTLIHAQVEGDRSFPDWRAAFPHVIESHSSADENFRYTFSVLGRREDRAVHSSPAVSG